MAGLAYLQETGHRIEPPVPSLFTFNIADKNFRDLMGAVVEPVVLGIPAQSSAPTGHYSSPTGA